MARRPARRAVAVGVTLAALASASALGGTAARGPGSPRAASHDTGPVTATSPATSTGAATTTDATDPFGPETTAAARAAYERRARTARTDSLDLAPVVGGRDRPNVLVLMTDDMRADDLQFMPNARELIGARGVEFANALAPHPLCCPSRASFLTGLYSHHHEVWSHVEPFGFAALDDRRTLPAWLREVGYRTLFLGKYLNGYGVQQLRDGSPSLRYVPPGWTDWRASVDAVESPEEKGGPLEGSTYRYFDTTLNVDGHLEPHEGAYQTHVYSRTTQEMLRREARQAAPFFAYVSFTAPHTGTPFEDDDTEPIRSADGRRQKLLSPARPDYVHGRFDEEIVRIPGGRDRPDRVEDKPLHVRMRAPLSPVEEDALLENYRQRAEALSIVDDEIGNVLAVLERTGELDNTYVLLTSDNGFYLGEHHRRQGKTIPYEPAVRVPLLMRGPGIPAGELRTDPFLTVDMVPTLLEAAGGTAPPGLDGVSLLDVARSGDRGWDRGVLLDTGPIAVPRRALRVTDPVRVNGRVRETRVSVGVRTARWTYLEHATGERELYDLRRDPFQWVNLVDRPRYAGWVRLLAAELDRLRDCAGQQCAAPVAPALRGVAPAPPRFPATTLRQGTTLTP